MLPGTVATGSGAGSGSAPATGHVLHVCVCVSHVFRAPKSGLLKGRCVLLGCGSFFQSLCEQTESTMLGVGSPCIPRPICCSFRCGYVFEARTLCWDGLEGIQWQPLVVVGGPYFKTGKMACFVEMPMIMPYLFVRFEKSLSIDSGPCSSCPSHA